MDTGREGIELQVILIAMIVVILLSSGVIVFFVTYQRRLLAQFKEQEKMKSDYQAELLKTSITSQEEERSRISKDLHDNIGAMLTTTKIYFQQVSSDLDPVSLSELRIKLNGMLEDMIESTRRISKNLSPIVLVKLGLVEALKSLLETLDETGRVTCIFEAPDSFEVSHTEGLNIYRIVQELTTNTLKHTDADRIWLKLHQKDSGIEIAYTDNGGGLNLNEVNEKKGIGLKNIDSRLSILKGTIAYTNSSDGIVVKLFIPRGVQVE